MKVFTIAEAEERFFEILEIAENGEPLMIKDEENRRAIMMSFKEYERLKAEADERENNGESNE